MLVFLLPFLDLLQPLKLYKNIFYLVEEVLSFELVGGSYVEIG